MPQNVGDLQKDDKFMALSPEAKAIVLGKTDPNFSKLSPEAQRIVVGRFKKPEDTDTFKYGVESTLPSLGDIVTTGKGLLGVPNKEQEERLKGKMYPHGQMSVVGETVGTIGKNIFEQQKKEFDKAYEMRPKDEENYLKTLPRRIQGTGHLVASAVPIFGPMAAEAGEDIGTGHMARGFGKATGTLGQVLAPRLVPKAAKVLARGAGAAAEGIARGIGITPEVEVVEGVSIPRLASEVRPQSIGGRMVKGAKRLGLNEKGFTEFSRKQNQAVKEVIKNVAGKTAKRRLTDLLDNPADALNKAADVVEEESRAMYQALDTTVDQIPGGGQVLIQGITPVVQKFLKEFPITQASLPGGDVVVEARGIASRIINQAESVTAPFQTAQDLRSALYKAARRTTDANTRRLILQGVEEVDTAMEEALSRSGNRELTNLWRDANKGWSKKYALNEVADAVNRAIKGSPAEIGDVPPKIAAKPLANLLNDLSTKHGRGLSVMERAFGADAQGQAHIMAIRRAVALLEEAQKVKTGGGFGKVRVATHAVMATGGIFTGHLGYAGAAMGVEIGAEQLSKAMTSLKGARAVERLLRADSATEAIPLRREVLEEANVGHVYKPFQQQAASRAATAPQGGHAGGRVSSVEELNRPGKHYIINRSNEVTAHGKSYSPEGTRPGSVHVTVKPNGDYQVNEGNLSASQKAALDKAVKETEKPKLTAVQTRQYMETKGKNVSVKGKPATVIGTAFGKITVKMQDGSIVRVEPDEIKAGLPPLK